MRQMIELIFSKFFELGSARQVMLWLLASGMQVAITSDRRGTVEWKAVTADYVTRMLTNPAYAGAYAYGRTTQRSRVVDGQLRSSTGRVRRSEWPVLLHDRHEAYISWQQFERVEQMLAKNAQARGGHGAARCGSALLAGLVFCRRCGSRMGVAYSGASRYGRYRCDSANMRRGAPKCISFSALDVDEHVARQLIAVVQPGAIEAARVAWERDAAGHESDARGTRTAGGTGALRDLARRTSVQRGRSGQSHGGARTGTAMERGARVGLLARAASRRCSGDAR